MTNTSVERAAATVVDVAAYFEELKERIAANRAFAQIAGRGYVTPSEEIVLRQLQVSYWQSRSALLELMATAQQETPADDSQQHAQFLVGFGAALTLVDAAWFLRSRFSRCPPLVDKLNEADDSLGLPPRTYQTIQRSLTHPRHLWRLLAARATYLRTRAELRRTYVVSPWTELISLIDRRLVRLRPSPQVYLRTRLLVWHDFLTTRLRRDVVGLGLYQIQKYASTLIADRYVRLDHQPALPAEVLGAVVARLRSGDVLVVRKEYALTNYFLPGYWPHAALYLGTHGDLSQIGVGSGPEASGRLTALGGMPHAATGSVLEALKDGVRFRSVDSPLASDSIVVLRPRLDRPLLAAGLRRVLEHEGKAYDFDFDFTHSRRLVCTEVVYRAYDGLGSLVFHLTRHAGRLALPAEGLIRMTLAGQGFDLAGVYSPEEGAEVLIGDRGMRVLAKRTPTRAQTS